MRWATPGRLAVITALLVVTLLAGRQWVRSPDQERPASFARGGITIPAGETVDKLVVVDGDAVIEGRVTGWLAVVGGSVDMRPSGFVSGPVFVLGGGIGGEAGGAPYQVVLPSGLPLVGLLASGLTIGLLVAVLLLWLLIRRLRRTRSFGLVLAWLQGHRQRWPWLYALTGLAASGLLLALFVHLAEETMLYHEADLLDNVIIWFVRSCANPAADRAMLAVTALGSGYTYGVLSAFVLGWLWWRARRREAVALAVCLAGAALLNFLLKHLFVRARPELFRVISETGYSFPSGHAMVSLCFYGMVAYLVCRRLSIAWQLAVYFFTTAMVLSIGISRIYLGVHFPSDVAAGYLAGGTWLVFCVSLLWWWEFEKERAGPFL